MATSTSSLPPLSTMLFGASGSFCMLYVTIYPSGRLQAITEFFKLIGILLLTLGFMGGYKWVNEVTGARDRRGWSINQLKELKISVIGGKKSASVGGDVRSGSLASLNSKGPPPLATDTMSALGFLMGGKQATPVRPPPSIFSASNPVKSTASRPSAPSASQVSSPRHKSASSPSAPRASPTQPSSSSSKAALKSPTPALPLITLTSPPSPYVPAPEYTLQESPLVQLKGRSGSLFSGNGDGGKEKEKSSDGSSSAVSLKKYTVAMVPAPKPEVKDDHMEVDNSGVRPGLDQKGSGYEPKYSQKYSTTSTYALSEQTLGALGKEKGIRIQILVDIYKNGGCDREAFIKEVGRVVGRGSDPLTLAVLSEVV